MAIPLSVIEDDSQHTMHYSQALPYAELLDHEAENWLNDICVNLTLSVKAQDFGLGCVNWARRLSNYMDMKHAISRKTRADLAKLLYELICIPGIESVYLESWSSLCIRLIRHKKRLGPEDLQLEWRPLYKIIDKILFPKSRQRGLISESKLLVSVIRLASYAQRFFSATATQEVLQEFLPKFTTHHVSQAIRAQGYLIIFLPSANQHHYTTQVQDYLPTLFSLWSIFANSSTYDTQFVSMLSRIAAENLDQGSLDIGLFTKQQVKTVFTTGLRMMTLPVGSRSDGSSSVGGAAGGTHTGYGPRVDQKAGTALVLRKRPEKFKSLARFIVYTIFPDQVNGTSYTLDLLSDMIQATELYFHPSNHGVWSFSLTTFARHLASEFLKRWREEKEEDCTTPQHRRLTEQLCKEFVLILRPVTYLSMFGKDQYTVGTSQATIKYLSWLEPGLIFPGLLERIYPSLETLTETHRTSSALSILADISLPLFSRNHYPAGGKHLLPLLQLAIPGIDMNDPHKTVSSLMFIATALMSIPICDLTQVPNTYFPTEDYMGQDGVELSRETEDYLVKQTTGEFEEWLAKFMRRVFTIFENLPQENRKKQGNMETGLTQMVLHTCDIVFNQLSERLYDLAFKLVVEFVNDRVLPNAVRAVGQLCDVMTTLNPKKAAKVFIPLCISNIQMELEHGSASTVSHAAASTLIPSDATFHWYQNILFSTVSSLGSEILVYKEEIMSVTKMMIRQCRSRRGMMWTGKLVRAVLTTTLKVYPQDFRSLNPSQWDDKEFMAQNAHQVWGQPGDPANLEIQWHTPSEGEKDFALDFLDEFLTPSVQRLEELMMLQQPSLSSHEISNELCRHLAIVRNCLMGSATMVADDGVDASSTIMDENDEPGTDDDLVTPTLPVGYAFTDLDDSRTQKARALRKSIGEFIHHLFDYFKTQREDDVESVKVLVKIARVYLAERGVERIQFDNNKNGYSFAKNVQQTPLGKKRYPRNLLIRRAYNHHLLRLRQNMHCRIRTPLHDAIMLDLFEMSVGSYAEIRKVSQNALSLTMRSFNGSKMLITPLILEALQPDTPADRMKGALYLLTHKSIMGAVLRQWKFIPGFVMAICGAQHQDKLSIQELIRRIFVSYISSYNNFSFRVLVPGSLSQVLNTLSPTTTASPDFDAKVQMIADKVILRTDKKISAYNGLLESLLDLLEDSRVHWRYQGMAANFVELFLRSDARPSQRLAAFANTAVLSELPNMRRTGQSATTQLLLYIKQRTLAAGNEDLLITREFLNPLKIEVEVQSGQQDLGRQLLNASYFGLTPDNVDSSILVDSTTLGWYVWPEKYTAYKVNTKDFYFDQIDPESLGAYEEFGKTFNTTEYWFKLCGYLSQETNQNKEDRFGTSTARLFCSIFQMYGDGPLTSAKEHIEALALASDQKNSQRAASEILAGLVRGTKHWNLTRLDSVWSWLTPLLRKVFNAITPDSLTYWESFTRFCSQRRDPRRIKPLMDLILESELDPTSDAAFNESRKLLLARTLMVSLQWRFEPLNASILPTYFNNLQHPYKQVREVIGVNINELLQLEWIPSYPSVEYLLTQHQGTDGVGNVLTTLNPAQEQRVEVVLSNLDRWYEEMTKSVNTISGSSDYAHASKTVLCWLHEALTHWSLSGSLPYIVPFLHKLFAMQEINDDRDLQNMATRVLNLIARTNYPPSMLPIIIDQFITILTTSTSWHMRIRALPVLQIFFFKHLFIMSSAQLIRIMEVIGRMLLDTQIEVRQLASVTLGGLVRCSQRDAIQSLLSQFTTQIEIRIPKRRRDKVTGKNVEPEGFAEAVLNKHAGVLGISCLINAFPYEVPEWMPVILCQLAECMSDPAAEIQATIRKTFSDFRRTHSDTWHEDMLKFDEDQLSLLSDMLISPSYYA